jgi:hypothetical protein
MLPLHLPTQPWFLVTQISDQAVHRPLWKRSMHPNQVLALPVSAFRPMGSDKRLMTLQIRIPTQPWLLAAMRRDQAVWVASHRPILLSCLFSRHIDGRLQRGRPEALAIFSRGGGKRRLRKRHSRTWLTSGR